MYHIIEFQNKKYVVELMEFDNRRNLLEKMFNQLTMGAERYNINPFPSKDWMVIPAELEHSKLLQDMETLAEYTGALYLDVYPKGTFYGNRPKEYSELCVKLEWRYY